MCKLFHELVGRLEPNLHTGMMKTWLVLSDLGLIFKTTAELNRLINTFLCASNLIYYIVGGLEPDLHGYNVGT